MNTNNINNTRLSESNNTHKLRDDSLELANYKENHMKEYNELILKIEEVFYSNLIEFDKENKTNRYKYFKDFFKTNNISPNDLYIEITNISKNAVYAARGVGVEIKEDGRERHTEKYLKTLTKHKNENLTILREKYGLTPSMYTQFKNNYCFCYSGKETFFCSSGNCILPNGKFWH